MLTYGFIGLGNMSTAIIKGMIASGDILPKQIYGMNRSLKKTTHLAEQLAIHPTKSIAELMNCSDVIIIGVKPQNLEEVLPIIKENINERHIIVSIAAGKSLQYLEQHLQTNRPIFRIMPNINAVVGASTSCYSANVANKEAREIVENIFSKVGTIVELPESLFSTFTSIGCASPAFTYLYIDSLARAGVKEGMSKEMALKVAASSVLGSAKMILESGEHPWALIDQVCSPGGTTIRGVTELQHNNFESSVYKAVQAVSDRDAELNKK